MHPDRELEQNQPASLIPDHVDHEIDISTLRFFHSRYNEERRSSGDELTWKEWLEGLNPQMQESINEMVQSAGSKRTAALEHQQMQGLIKEAKCKHSAHDYYIRNRQMLLPKRRLANKERIVKLLIGPPEKLEEAKAKAKQSRARYREKNRAMLAEKERKRRAQKKNPAEGRD